MGGSTHSDERPIDEDSRQETNRKELAVQAGIAQAVGDTSESAWLAFGGLVLVLLVVTTSTSLVPSGQRRVVTRGGRVRRVVERGIAWRLPIVERFEPVLSEPHDLPVSVRARTIDDVPVLVLLETMVRFMPPQSGRRYVDPWPTAEEALQTEVATLVSRLPVAELRHALRTVQPRLTASAREVLAPLGVELCGIEVVEIDLPLASDRGPD
jgi:regulator of protease activity HflC (stomatin/prohibitin superfamily)